MSNCAKSTRPAPAPTTGEDRRRGLLLLATGSCGKRTGSRSSLLAPLVMACGHGPPEWLAMACGAIYTSSGRGH